MFAEKIPSDEGMPSGTALNRTFTDQTPSADAPLAFMPNATFAARFCAHQGIPFDQFQEVLLQRTLHRSALQVRTLLNLKRNFFAPDREFIESVGRASNMRELEAVINDFSDSRTNDGLLRGTLKMRVSARKLRRIARQYLQHRRSGDPALEPSTDVFDVVADEGSTRQPFAGPDRRRKPLNAPQAESRQVDQPVPNLVSHRDKSGDISMMQQEIARLTEQREVLKKAVGIFCESDPSPRLR
jgi:hypothetical protein